MLRSLSTALDRLYLFAGWIAGALLVAMCCLVTYNIIARLLSLYSGGAAEYSGYTMAASSFLALAYTFRSNGHIRVSLLLEHCGLRGRKGLEILCTGIMAATVCYFAWHCIRLVLDSRMYGDVSDGADAMPLWIPQIPMALGAAIFAISCIHSFVLALGGRSPIGPEAGAIGEVREI